MSGELGLAGYRFQYHVMVLAALEHWADGSDTAVEAIVVEGRADADVVDYELVGQSLRESAIVQVKGRWGRQPWSAPEVFRILTSLAQDERSVQLELVANGAFTGPALRLAGLLANASHLDDQSLKREVLALDLAAGDVSAEVLASLRRSVVTIRTEGLPELRDEVRVRLRKLRAASRAGVGDHAAELLRAYLLEVAMNKSEAEDLAGRTLTREEFLEAVRAPRSVLEGALASRWGIPIGLIHRDTAVRREDLLDNLAACLKDADGVHAADGHVRACVVVGPAGIGKTTLAQQYALHNAGEFDWLYQITAQDDNDDAACTEDILREELEQFALWLPARNVPVRPGPYRSLADAGRAIAEALATCAQTWMLIIDNATTADTLSSLLPAAGHGAIVITSRNSAWTGPQPVLEVGELTPEQGRELVERRLNGMTIDRTQAETLCQEVGYLPLTLVTATSYLRSTRESVSAFVASLADEVTRLDTLNFPQRLDDYPRNAVAAVTMVMQRLTARKHGYAAQAMDLLQRAAVVFPDRIPVDLIAGDRHAFNQSFAQLSELSLLTRWQDDEQRDWVRVHRLIQDVVRADLDRNPVRRDALLREVEITATDLLKDCTDRFDFVVGGALRLHAITLAERLDRHGLQRWQSTTALLANAASVAHIQGDFVEEQRCLEQALALLPADSYDPHVAGRRGKTLASLAIFQLERSQEDAALETLEEARRVHDVHRFIPSHYEALIMVMAMQYQVRAYRARDEREVKQIFELALELPEPTAEAAIMRAASLLRIARFIDSRAGHRAVFDEAADRLFNLIRDDEDEKSLHAATAHLGLAEAHGSDGGTDAAWRHYSRAMNLITHTQGIDPVRASDEAMELVAGLLGVHLDQNTQLPHSDINELLRRILADVEQRLDKVDWTATQRIWFPVRFHALKAMFFANIGDMANFLDQLGTMEGYAAECPVPLPRNAAAQVAMLPGLRLLARTQQVRLSAPSIGVYGPRNLPAPDRPAREPVRCRHFDPRPAPVATQVAPQSDSTPTPPAGTGVRVNRARAIARHAELLRMLGASGITDLDPALRSLRQACDDPASAIDHLIGAWRMLDTMIVRLSAITGEVCDSVREMLDAELVRAHHDHGTDTVPARVVLRLMHEGWHPELNQVLMQCDSNSMFEILASLLELEDAAAQKLSHYLGGDKGAVIRSVAEETAKTEDSIPDPSGPTYSPISGTVVYDRDLLGEPNIVRLHDPRGAEVDHTFVLGGAQDGKSTTLHKVICQAAMSGVFVVIACDPRDDHNVAELWSQWDATIKCIGTHVAGTLENLEVAKRIIDARLDASGFARADDGHPGILLAIDDADDIFQLPRGRRLIETILDRGPSVCVGLVAVIRDLAVFGDSDTVLRSIADSVNAICLGQDALDAVRQLRADYDTR
ncbi:NB-ARC domain-containing protein [Amycolatopsis sp. NPDC059657]|uniref:NB-ARC domain-containing protein n=1 Tax=Amycolatopsis sp. NPDC059657 TaxID=3346899 RepID=UPI00366FDD36